MLEVLKLKKEDMRPPKHDIELYTLPLQLANEREVSYTRVDAASHADECGDRPDGVVLGRYRDQDHQR